LPASEPSRVIAVGLARVHDGETVREAQLTVTMTKLRRSQQPSQDSAEAFAAGMADEAVAAGPGLRIRGGRPTTRLVTLGDRVFARISFDIEGATGSLARLQHYIGYTVWAPEGPYMLGLNTMTANGPAIDALADEIARTVRLTRPAPARSGN
jgi:hypothetical protein